MLLNSAPDRCCEVPLPADPKLIGIFFCFTSSTNSLRSFAARRRLRMTAAPRCEESGEGGRDLVVAIRAQRAVVHWEKHRRVLREARRDLRVSFVERRDEGVDGPLGRRIARSRTRSYDRTP